LFHPVPPVIPPATAADSEPVPAGTRSPGRTGQRNRAGLTRTCRTKPAAAHGNISNATRTVADVTSMMLNGGWYLNLHQGNSNNILSNGQPTALFRPLLRANI
jgi:hypothetical protein